MFELTIHDSDFSVIYNKGGMTIKEIQLQLAQAFRGRKIETIVSERSGEALIYVDDEWVATVRTEPEEKELILTK